MSIRGRPMKHSLADPKEIIDCNYCGGRYTRWNISHHKKTKRHQIFMKMNDIIRRVVLENVNIDFDNRTITIKELKLKSAKLNLQKQVKSKLEENDTSDD